MAEPGIVTDRVKRAASASPAAFALSSPAGALRYFELDAEIDRVARGLISAGAGPGRTVALLADPGADAVAAVHAVLRSGAVLSPLSGRWTDAELRDVTRLLEPHLVLCDEATAARAERIAPAGSWVARVRALAESGEGREDEFPLLSPDTPAAIVWTSGSSGRPKGVELSHGNLQTSAEAVAQRLGLSSRDAWYASLDLAHVGGLSLVLRAASTGSRLVLRGRFSAEDFRDLATRGEITHASLVPTMLSRILDVSPGPAPSVLRCILLGGDRASNGVVAEAVERGYPIALTYGLTEASSQVATAPPELVRRKPGTVGAPLDGVEVRLAEDGEIQVRGAVVGRVRPLGEEGSPGQTPEWLSTGDLGVLDEDGHLWVEGRKTDRIISGGVNVDPREVEDLLIDFPGVADACVVGLPDVEWGERVVAAVVAEEGEPTPEMAALSAFYRDRLAPAKRPREFLFVGELPRNTTGKTDRNAVRHLLQDRLQG